MAVRYSRATGNFLTNATWGQVDSTSYLNSETAAHVVTTAFSGTRTVSFTPGAITVDGIAVKLNVRTGTTGTISVHLALNSTHVEVAGTLVTINTADLPAAVAADINGGWIFFKFSSPVTLSAATAYELEVTTSSSNQVSLWRDSTSGNVSRCLVTTTTGAPAAGDDIIVGGEYTGAGASNSFTVTMNETATTDYGAASTSLVTPALAVCAKGILRYGTSAATNYYLKLSGNAIVYAEGELDLGTTGTAIPRNSTAVLEFDCAADGDFGLTVRNLGTYVAQGLSRSSGKDIVSCKLNTDEAVNSTSLGIDTDTGWLDNDQIVVASTTQTSAQSELGALNGNANASDITVDGFGGAGGGLANAHSGTSPTQAEVILLTRNVMVRSALSTAMSYCNFKATSTVDIDWVDFRYIGRNSTGQRGLEIETTTGSFSMQYSCVRDCEYSGVYITGAATNNITISNNTFYNLVSAAASTAYGVNLSQATTGTSITFNNNVLILKGGSAGAGFGISDLNITFTNNVAVSCGSSRGFEIGDSSGNTSIGTFSGNSVHSCQFGIQLNCVSNGTIGSMTWWRNSAGGILQSAGSNTACYNLVFDTWVAFGNSTSSWNPTAPWHDVTMLACVSNGDSSFATSNGFLTGGNSMIKNLRMINCDFSTAGGIKTAHTNDINIQTAICSVVEIYTYNTKLGASNEVITQSSFNDNSVVYAQKHDQTAGLHKTWKKYGTIQIEGTTVHTGAKSMKMTPNNASNKLVSPSFYVAVSSGQTVTPTVYVYEDASYNGNRARLIVKRNDAMGISSDTVLDTATAASDAAWEALTGTTASVTDDGVLEFVVDCDGTAGNLFVDSFSAA